MPGGLLSTFPFSGPAATFDDQEWSLMAENPGMYCGGSGYGTPAQTASGATDTVTQRKRYTAPARCCTWEMIFAGFYVANKDTDPEHAFPNDVYLKVSIELNDGQIIPFTFGGATEGTLRTTDLFLATDIGHTRYVEAGENYWVRVTSRVADVAHFIPTNSNLVGGTSQDANNVGDSQMAGDYSASGAMTTATTSRAFMPCAVRGLCSGLSIYGPGHSISAGTATVAAGQSSGGLAWAVAANQLGVFYDRAADTVAGLAHDGIGGTKLYQRLDFTTWFAKRKVLHARIFQGVRRKVAIIDCATNDDNDVTMAVMKANTVAYAKWLSDQGFWIIWVSLLPKTNAVSVTGSITAASNAPAAVLTQVGHPYSTGDPVQISGFTGSWTPCNGWFIVTKLTADTFSIPIDSSTFGAKTGTPISYRVTGGWGSVADQALRSTDVTVDPDYPNTEAWRAELRRWFLSGEMAAACIAGGVKLFKKAWTEAAAALSVDAGGSAADNGPYWKPGPLGTTPILTGYVDSANNATTFSFRSLTSMSLIANNLYRGSVVVCTQGANPEIVNQASTIRYHEGSLGVVGLLASFTASWTYNGTVPATNSDKFKFVDWNSPDGVHPTDLARALMMATWSSSWLSGI